MSEKEENKKKIYGEWHGIEYRASAPFCTQDRRRRSRLYVLGLDGKALLQKPKQLSTAVGGSEKDLLEMLQKELPECVYSCADQLIQQALENPKQCLRLESYAQLRRKDIQLLDKWAGKAEAYWRVWEELCPVFGDLSVTQCTDSRMFEDRMETITHRKRRKMGYTEREQTYWIVLNGILRCAADQDGLLEESPLRSIAKECREKLSTLAGKDLARQSLDHEELVELLSICVPGSRDSDFHSAVILQVLTGMTVAELCGLNVEDWKKGDDQISWLEITREYKQGRYKTPLLTNLLGSGNAYRRIPCTEATEQFLKRQRRRMRSAAGQDEPTPLFRGEDNERLTPQEYKVKLQELLDPIIRKGAVLPFVERNSFLKGENRPSIFHGDLLRSTAEYYYRTVCGMNVSEIAAVLGINREHTFAIFYVDWGNHQVLMYLKAKIHRWHSDLVTGPEAAGATGQPQIRRGCTISGTAAPGAVIRITGAHGVEGILEPME